MKKGISFLLSVILMITTAGCGTINQKIDKNFKDMKSYIATVKITVNGNKSTTEYRAKQFWESPDKYRVEIIEPERMSGTVTVYTDNEIFMQSKDTPKQRIERGLSVPDKDFMFISDFVNEYYILDQMPEFQNGDEVILTSETFENNKNRFVQNLIINPENGQPLKLITYNDKGDEVISVEYEEFISNCEIDESLFIE